MLFVYNSNTVSEQILRASAALEELNHHPWMSIATAVGATAVLLSGAIAVEAAPLPSVTTEAVATAPPINDDPSPTRTVHELRPPRKVHKYQPPKHPAEPRPAAQPKPSSPAIRHPLAVQAHKPPLRMAELRALHSKSLSFEFAEPQLKAWVGLLPTLPELGKRFPESYPDVDEQLAKIDSLHAESAITAEDLSKYHINTDLIHAFDGMPEYQKRITPEMFLWHWTAQRYEGGVKQFAESVRNAGKRVEFFIDRAGTTYQLFDSDSRFPAHALSMNQFSQGVEIEANGLYDYTPDQIKAAKLLTIRFLQRNNLKANPETVMTHAGGDLLFNNPFYENSTGQFHASQGRQPSVRKSDCPKELLLGELPDIQSLR